MRKHTPRKWLHAILDLLPVLIIPIFAIYTRNEANTFENNVTIEIEQNEVVMYNQLRTNDYINGSFSAEQVNQYGSIDVTKAPIVHGHVYYTRLDYSCSDTIWFKIGGFGAVNYILNLTPNNTHAVLWDTFVDWSVDNDLLLFQVPESYTDFTLDYYKLQVFDLTLMFGEGNEPTAQQFDEWYPFDNSYEYSLGTKKLLKGISTVTYNDTDIGSQFMYTLYKPVDKYFNFNKLFNMQDVYDWLQLNLFEGNAPIPVHIVWNIIVYEFFMDLIFLLYSFFMFIIDWSTSMIDRFLYKARS